jgi:hypothetical protein
MRYALVVTLCLCGFITPACLSDGTGGSGSCGDFECSNLLTISVVRRDSEPFVSGEYTFTLAIDETEIRVVCFLDTEDELSCSEDTDILSVTLNPTADEFTLRIDRAPPRFSFEVRLNAGIIGSEALMPDYQIIVGDNPECTESCWQGSHVVRVEAPPEN